MSSIFGFVCADGYNDEAIRTEKEKKLAYRNREYGSATASVSGKGFYFGSFIEHFSDRFPAGAPVAERDGRIWLTDALLYNRDELLPMLGEPSDASLSDEELLIRLVAEKGFDALRNINGDFAGAVYDRTDGTLTLFRDHTGIRQLYYYTDENQFAFSTDIRGLGALPDADLRIDEEIVWLELAGRNYYSLDRTEFEKIRCVLPGSVMTIRTGKSFDSSQRRYWKPGQKKIRLADDRAYIEEMKKLTTDAIRRRADAFPGVIGSELSGGLDSSVISILINRLGRQGKYISWRIVPDDWPMQPGDERIIIRDVCEQEHIACEFLPEKQKGTASETKVLPVCHNTPQLGQTAKLASESGAKCVFTGQGGDEGVSHRPSVLELWYFGEYLSFFRELWSDTQGKKLRLLRTLRMAGYNVFVLLPKKRKSCSFSAFSALPLLTEEYKNKMNDRKGFPFLFSLSPVQEFEHGGVRRRAETGSYQAAEYGVRFLFPYQDYRLFDYALSIPRNLFLRKGEKRWIYIRAFEELMPPTLREVDYKDFPSTRNARPEIKIDPEVKTGREVLLETLDWERWGGMVDRDALNALPDVKTESNAEIVINASNRAAVLGVLARLQQFQDRCGEED